MNEARSRTGSVHTKRRSVASSVCLPVKPALLARRTLTLALVLALGSLLCALLASALARAEAGEPARSPFVAVGEAVLPAVVNIRITRAVNAGGIDETPLQEMFRRFFPDREGQGGRFENPGTGSGFVVGKQGEILTNHHVIAGADRILVRFCGEQREYEAQLTGSDPSTDLALLRIDAGGRDLPYLVFGDSGELSVGDWAIAVGNPFGNLEGTMTVGIVSGQGRGDLVIQGLTPRYQDFIQTDASINFGNSGGPLVDIRGSVIGVNTAINAQGQGIGFAVPSRIVQRVYAQLREHGRVIRGFLGVRTADVVAGDDAGEGTGGVRVLDLVPESPAARAGVAPGDVIVAFGGEPVSSARQLDFLVAEAEVGRRLVLDVDRDGNRRTLDVELAELTDKIVLPKEAPGHWLGLDVASLADKDDNVSLLKKTLGIDAAEGVIVVTVEPGRPAAQAGIRAGDVLVAIEGQEIPDLEAFSRARDALGGRRDSLTMLIRTGRRESFVQVTPRDVGSLQ
jgi:serine protease Do